MKISSRTGNVVQNTTVVVTYTVEEGDPATFFFQVLVGGSFLVPVGPAGPLSKSGTFTTSPGDLGSHVVEVFESGQLPKQLDAASFATGPTFTAVASSALSSAPGAPSPATLSTEPSPTTQASSGSAHITTIPLVSASGAGLNLCVSLLSPCHPSDFRPQVFSCPRLNVVYRIRLGHNCLRSIHHREEGHNC
ncbi:hypothetical protein FB45DRAFT_228495 [Roridomyces roridus]|uniref:Uncharacterized protein n=1 Tax=Roridomyces roridus TaxID=1738132 RepID=A0AAD7F7V7_9AGAR|nr:hypothetical protein FB45DRAFT_228495 [Roridomyces roridus]